MVNNLHRTANVNEYSTRYSIAIDEFEVADEWRGQATINKQGSTGPLTDWPEVHKSDVESLLGDSTEETITDWQDAQLAGLSVQEYLSARESELHSLATHVYKERLALGVAREQARKDLPLSTYTEVYYKQDLHNLLHFMWLRTDPHAQKEIRDIANAIGEIVEAAFPITYKAWCDYKRDSMILSNSEIDALGNILMKTAIYYEFTNILGAWEQNPKERESRLLDAGLTSKSERIDFINKLKYLMRQ